MSAPAEHLLEAQTLATSLGLPLVTALEPPRGEWVVWVGPRGLELHPPATDQGGVLRVDFVAGATGYRLRQGSHGWGALAKAVGFKGGGGLTVVDATAGLGRDGLLLAAMGCRVTLIERSPVLAALLADGLARARHDPALAPVLERITGPWCGEAARLLTTLDPPPEVVYLDPMYPGRKKSALVKEPMRRLRELVGEDADAPELLQAALGVAGRRVVVKRPKGAPPLPGPLPHHPILTTGTRFDVYLPAAATGTPR